MANDEWDIFDKEIKRSVEVARKTKDLCIEPYIKELAIYKRALELARLDGLEMDDYLVEAKKELEEQDGI